MALSLSSIVNPINLIPLPYKILAGVLLILSLTGFVYYKGYKSGHSKADTELANYAAKVSTQALQISNDQTKINEKLIVGNLSKVDTIRTVTVKNVNHVKEVPVSVVTTVHDTVTRIELPLGWLSVYNASAGGYNADSTSIVDGTASGITPNNALGFVVQNNGTCQETAQRLISLQSWVSQTRLSIDSANKRKP